MLSLWARRSGGGRTFSGSRRAVLKALWKGGCEGATVVNSAPRRAPGAPAGSSGSVVGNLAPKAGRRRRRRVLRRRRPPGRLDRTSSGTGREAEQGRADTAVEAVDQGNFSKLKARTQALQGGGGAGRRNAVCGLESAMVCRSSKGFGEI